MIVALALTMWANHPWLTRVYEYRPAPGQFINTMPIAAGLPSVAISIP